jgi:metal-sulfur cluster biosynthetic enzyme
MPSPTQPAALTEASILAALRDCYDPELALNIVDLGLVHSISIAPDPHAPGAGIPGVPPRQRVAISLTLASIVEPSDFQDSQGSQDTPLIALIENRLAAFETISHTDVTLLREPAWNPGRISPEGRRRIALDLTSKQSASKQPAHALIQIQTRPGKT